MAWQFIIDGTGREWAVDPDLMYALVRANVRANEIKKRMRVEVERHTFGPDLTNVVINYNGLSAAVDAEARRWWDATKNRASVLAGEAFLEELASLRKETRERDAAVEEAQANAQRATRAAIDSSVESGEFALTVATWTRDISASILVAGATMLTGGAAAAVLAGGAGLKGVAKYQDTGNVGSAVIEAGGNVVIGAIGIAGEAATVATDKRVLLVLGSAIDGVLEGSKAIAEGQKAEDAAKVAAAKFGVGLASGLIPFDKFGVWVKMRAVVSGGVGVAGDKAVAAAGASPVAGGKLNKPPVAKALSWASGAGTDDADYVRTRVLCPIAEMPGFAGVNR